MQKNYWKLKIGNWKSQIEQQLAAKPHSNFSIFLCPALMSAAARVQGTISNFQFSIFNESLVTLPPVS
jgi:hypothetical protein